MTYGQRLALLKKLAIELRDKLRESSPDDKGKVDTDHKNTVNEITRLEKEMKEKGLKFDDQIDD